MDVTIKSYRKEREAEIITGLQKSMEQVGQLVERQAKKNVTRPMPSGILDHTWRDTGILAGSIIHQVTTNNNEIAAEIGTNVYYGKFLELGTVRMPAYPWLFPAVEVNRNNIIKLLNGREFKVE